MRVSTSMPRPGAQPTSDWAPGARILEIGCAEADWLGWIGSQRPDLQLVGLDWRERGQSALANVVVLTGNVLTMAMTPASVDGVVMVSTLEHIGLGHYDHDPLDEDGDTHCLTRVAGWLKLGGRVYADVPYQPDCYQVSGTSHREYDDAAIVRRLHVPGLREVWRGFAYAGDTTTFVPPPTVRAEPFYYVGLVFEKVA